jgi:hypothetical protein
VSFRPVASLLLLRHATRPFSTLAAYGGARSEAAGANLLTLEGRAAEAAARVEDALHAAAGPKNDALDANGARARLDILALRRAVHNRRSLDDVDLDAAARFLSPPLLDELRSYRRAIEACDAAAADWEEAFAADHDAGLGKVLETARDPLVSFGILLAGRSLIGKLHALDGKSPASWGHGERHVAAKALAYIARFATKTSPNSVFCATALADAHGGRATIEGSAAPRRVDLILSVAEARKAACTLAADETVEAAVTPRPNPTLREEDGAWSFWRFASVRNASDDETLSRVKVHPVAARAVLEASAGRLTVPELCRHVAERCGIDEAELSPFLRRMIESGVLIGEIEIPYNERRPLRHVALRARDAGCGAHWIPAVLAIEDDVDRLAGLDGAERARGMARIEAALEALPHARPIKTDELYRVDTAGGFDVTLPASVLEDLSRALRPYARLFGTLYPARRYLKGWVDRFLARFPADRDVALLDVYRTVIEQDDSYRPAAFPQPAPGESEEDAQSGRAMTAVREHLAAAARYATPGDAIELDDAVLDRLVPGTVEPRWAAGVLFQVAASDVDAITRGHYLIAINGIFHGAGLSLSRFAHLLGDGAGEGNPVVRELRRAWSILDRPGAIVAELTYNHLGRTANAGLRPSIFEHEIELPGDCASPEARVLALRDLCVRFDSAASRFVLSRERDGTEVLPVINSGVNPVGFVSFLVAIGEQGLQPIAYFPGFDAPGVTHWPRVVSGRVVLFRERWVFRAGEWPEAPARGDKLYAFARAVMSWRERHRLPRHVFVHSSKEPKPRYFDLASPVFLDLLRRDLVGLAGEADAGLHVTEMLPGPGDLFAADASGRYATEFLAQMDGGPLGSPA